MESNDALKSSKISIKNVIIVIGYNILKKKNYINYFEVQGELIITFFMHNHYGFVINERKIFFFLKKILLLIRYLLEWFQDHFDCKCLAYI